jgi:hypothetical protein
MLVACLVSPIADADVCVTTQSDLLRLIDGVSERTGLKFVVDPRVRAQVTLAGFQDEDVTFDRLKAILTMHDFAALESPADQLVYVVPSKVADTIKPKLGIP